MVKENKNMLQIPLFFLMPLSLGTRMLGDSRRVWFPKPLISCVKFGVYVCVCLFVTLFMCVHMYVHSVFWRKDLELSSELYRGSWLAKVKTSKLQPSLLISRWTKAESGFIVSDLFHGAFFYCFFWQILLKVASPIIKIAFLIFWVQGEISCKR